MLALGGISMVSGYWFTSAAGPGPQLASILLGALVGLALCLWIWRDSRFVRIPPIWLFAVAGAVRLLATQASPLLEDDHYRYLWDGFQTVSTGNPYRWAPSHFFGTERDDANWGAVLGGINNPDIPTIYGPVLQGLFVIAYGVNPGHVGAIQGILCGIDLLTLWLLARSGTPMRWLLVYAIHPLVLKEAMASAHPDGLVGLLLLLAVLAWQRRRPIWLGIALGLAVATKVSALVAMPFFFVPAVASASMPSRQITLTWVGIVGVAFCTSLALCYAPFLSMGGADWRGLAVFGQQWRFNPLLYRLLEQVTPAVVTRAAAGMCFVSALAIVWLRWLRCGVHEPRAIPPVDTALLLLLLLSPVVNPWYWLWAFPVAVYRGRLLVVGLAALGAVSYVNSTVMTQIGWSAGPQGFSVPWAMTWLQIATVVLLWLTTARLDRKSRGYC
jgi:alpha-1,6-mannosyltransferase